MKQNVQKKSSKKLRVAIIGCGPVATWGHVPYWTQESRIEVVALCDIMPERTQLFRDKYFPKAKQFSDYRKMLECKDIDAVDICTPNDLHSEMTVAAFAAGKHVFCEKPDAISVKKALEMKAASEKAGKVLMVMRNNRFADASKFAKKFVEDGKMGEIYAGRCGWQRRRGIPDHSGWFLCTKRSGGGPLIDLGVHMIDLAIWLMGNPRPVAVSANAFRKFPGNCKDSPYPDDVEDLAMGLIRFDNGAVLQIEFSWASNVKGESRFVELRGSKAGLSWKEGKLEFYTDEGGQLLDVVPAGNLIEDGHSRNLKNFVDTVLGVEKPCFVPQQGVDMIKILCAVYESAKTGFEVRL